MLWPRRKAKENARRIAEEEAGIESAVSQAKKRAITCELNIEKNIYGESYGIAVTGRIAAPTLPTSIGYIDIIISGGELILTIDNATFDHKTINPDLDTLIQIDQSTLIEETVADKSITGQTDNFHTGASGSLSLKGLKVTGKAEGKTTEKKENETNTGITRKFTITESTLTILPSGDDIIVYFKIPKGIKDTKIGKFIDHRICTANIMDNQKPTTVKVTFCTYPKYITTKNGTGLFEEDKSITKQWIIDRLVAKLLEKEWSVANLSINDTTQPITTAGPVS